MALRVLLADESSTIKKVFQLALQDFAVEVRPVNLGVDVASVASSFKPDIIFADVLLQKKNGYEVCSDLKQDTDLRAIPVVLMWSGFMEFDEDKFQASQANAQLEKPFDVAALRKLVTDLVPRTKNQRLSQFLTFPKANSGAEKRPEFIEAQTPAGAQSQNEKYRLNLKPEELDPNHIAVKYDMPDDDSEFMEKDEFTVRETKKSKAPPPATTDDDERVELDEEATTNVGPASVPAAAAAAAAATAPPQLPGLSAKQLEKIIREQSAEVIEAVVWKVIPELATQIIERELNRLLKERDSHPF